MQLKHLKLTGFKSFADPTVFEFLPGLTGIIGPNGCGKSNILESFRWVMGATSAKALRASTMDDVIFNGTGGRPSRNWAEVVINFELDNQEQATLIGQILGKENNQERNYEISRKIYKKADGNYSSYRVNGKEVRARDIQLIFVDMSLGANATSLVRQGQVADLIGSSSANRHRILEEAAGVSGINSRRQEAYRKLKSALTNIERLEEKSIDIISRRKTLSKQAKEAQKYTALQEQAQSLQSEILLGNLFSTNNQLKKLHIDFQQTQQKFDLTKQVATSLGEKNDEYRLLIPKQTKELNEIKQVFNEKDNLEKDLKREITTSENLITQLQSQIDNLHIDKKNLTTIITETEEQKTYLYNKLPKNYLNPQTTISNQIDEELEQEKKSLDTITSQKTELKNKKENFSQKQALLFKNKNTREIVLNNIGSLKTQIKELTLTKDNLQNIELPNIATLQNDFNSSVHQLKDIEEKEKANATLLFECKELFTQCDIDLRKAKVEKENIIKQKTFISKQIEKNHQTANNQNQNNSILKHLDIKSGYEKAVLAVLNTDINSSFDNTNKRFWSELGNEEISASFPEELTILSEIVKAPSKLTCFLKSVAIIDIEDFDLYYPALAPGQILVTKDGQVFRWDGFIANEPSSVIKDELDNITQLNNLKKELQQLIIHEQENNLCKDKLANQLLTYETRLAQYQNIDKQGKEQYEKSLKLRYSTEQILTLTQQKTEDNKQKVLNINNKINELENELKQKSQTIVDQEVITNLEKEINSLSDEIEQQSQNIEQADRLYYKLKNHRLETEKQSATHIKEYQTCQQRLTKSQEQLKQIKVRLESSLNNIKEQQLLINQKNILFTDVCQQTPDLKEKISHLENRNQQTLNQESTVSSQHIEALKTFSNAKENLTRIQIKLDNLTSQKQELTDKINELKITIPEDENNFVFTDQNDLKTQLLEINTTLDKIGGINHHANEELEQLLKDSDGLINQLDDTKTAAKRLEKSVNNLTKDASKKLDETMEKINLEFGNIFTKLFRGGHAKIVRIEGDKPLESGLEIMCSPPGKKLGNLNLLSGGEQALTAISLIFAVFLINPSAICILDEVDAPLDEANVERFCDLIQDINKRTKTKFVVITHHALTMSKMDRLFGVTMSEPGISRLVAVDLNIAEKMIVNT